MCLDYTMFDEDWFKLTLPFGIKLILDDFQPLAAMLFFSINFILLGQLELWSPTAT
jgi:hypothetical protein